MSATEQTNVVHDQHEHIVGTEAQVPHQPLPPRVLPPLRYVYNGHDYGEITTVAGPFTAIPPDHDWETIRTVLQRAALAQKWMLSTRSSGTEKIRLLCQPGTEYVGGEGGWVSRFKSLLLDTPNSRVCSLSCLALSPHRYQPQPAEKQPGEEGYIPPKQKCVRHTTAVHSSARVAGDCVDYIVNYSMQTTQCV